MDMARHRERIREEERQRRAEVDENVERNAGTRVTSEDGFTTVSLAEAHDREIPIRGTILDTIVNTRKGYVDGKGQTFPSREDSIGYNQR